MSTTETGIPYVSVLKDEHGKPKIAIRYKNEKDVRRALKVFPLTKKGYLEAGAELYARGFEHWTNSSSVDFPEEISPRLRFDVRELMVKGFTDERDKGDVPYRALLKKMMARCGQADFQKTLTDEERAAYVVIKSGGGPVWLALTDKD